MRPPAALRAAVPLITVLTAAACGSTGSNPPAQDITVPSAPAQPRALATTAPRTGHGAFDASQPTCSGITYRVTSRGLLVTADISGAPGQVTFEAQDAQGSPVTGDPSTSDAITTLAKPGGRTVLIRHVWHADHVFVLPVGSPSDSCVAYKS